MCVWRETQTDRPTDPRVCLLRTPFGRRASCVYCYWRMHHLLTLPMKLTPKLTSMLKLESQVEVCSSGIPRKIILSFAAHLLRCRCRVPEGSE